MSKHKKKLQIIHDVCSACRELSFDLIQLVSCKILLPRYDLSLKKGRDVKKWSLHMKNDT